MDELNIVSDGQQNVEWFAARVGCMTASRIADVIAKPKRGTGELQVRANYKRELVVERITAKTTEHYFSGAMEWGITAEPLARACYELRQSVSTDQVGFVLHPSIEWAGCSPDGLVGNDGMIEIKCPNPGTHADYLLAEYVPEAYVPQMMWQMACCPGRMWNDFISYCPDFPEPLDLFVCRLLRDEKLISEMEDESSRFLSEVAEMTAKLRSKVPDSGKDRKEGARVSGAAS